jgi:hypothetical protein
MTEGPEEVTDPPGTGTGTGGEREASGKLEPVRARRERTGETTLEPEIETEQGRTRIERGRAMRAEG